jgi:hydroxymethylbilane synthase
MRLGTRGSALALAQAHLVAQLLGGAELVPITTTGDRGAGETGQAPRPAAGAEPGRGVARNGEQAMHAAEQADKSRWVDAIEAALLAGEIDLAVHSAKDVPGELAAGLALLGAPARAAAADALCVARDGSSGRSSGRAGLDVLPPGARVGTSSLRRAAQLRATRDDLEIVAMRGNIDTRLRKLAERRQADPTPGTARSDRGASAVESEHMQGELDAIVLARAGLVRLGREEEIGTVLDPARFVPAPGQGALALEGRADDERMRRAAQAITDADTFACLTAERAVARALGASCHTPLGAHAAPAGCGRLNLRVWVGLPDGSEWASDELLGGSYDPAALGARVAERLRSAGAADLLRRAEEMAVELA